MLWNDKRTPQGHVTDTHTGVTAPIAPRYGSKYGGGPPSLAQAAPHGGLPPANWQDTHTAHDYHLKYHALGQQHEASGNPMTVKYAAHNAAMERGGWHTAEGMAAGTGYLRGAEGNRPSEVHPDHWHRIASGDPNMRANTFRHGPKFRE